MEAHYTEKFSLDVMAKALFIDKVYLSKTFREISGETPLCYFHRLRCEKAAALLEDTDLSIEIIGVKAGFATPSHFSRIFKEVFGLTPSEYREKYYASLTV